MFENIFREKQNKWNENLAKCIKAKGYKTASFTRALNEKYNTSTLWKTVRDWQNVGGKRGKCKALIGFPEFEKMIMIADCLNVDIGYLLGETDAETFTLGKASDFLHLEPEALKNLKRVIEKEQNRFVEPNEYTYSAVLNKLLCSEHFESFVESLNELENTYIDYKNIIPNLSELNELELDEENQNRLDTELSNKYGRAVLEQAHKYHNDTFEDEDTMGLTNEVREAEVKINDISSSSYIMYIFVRSKSDWHTIENMSLKLLNVMNTFINKYGVDFLETIWATNVEPFDKEQKEDISHFNDAQFQFYRFFKKVCNQLKKPIIANKGLLTAFIQEIERLSSQYSGVVLEKAWKYHKVCKAIDELEENDDFLYKLKKEIGYHRYLVQENLVLLLNDIYPTSFDLHNIF